MENPVQHQVKAFNKRNLNSFMEAFSEDIEAEDGNGESMMKGTEEFRSFYKNLFQNSPDLHCDIVNRTKVGNWVIDEEKLEGMNMEGFPKEAHAVVAYKLEDGEIKFVRMFS